MDGDGQAGEATPTEQGQQSAVDVIDRPRHRSTKWKRKSKVSTPDEPQTQPVEVTQETSLQLEAAVDLAEVAAAPSGEAVQPFLLEPKQQDTGDDSGLGEGGVKVQDPAAHSRPSLRKLSAQPSTPSAAVGTEPQVIDLHDSGQVAGQDASPLGDVHGLAPPGDAQPEQEGGPLLSDDFQPEEQPGALPDPGSHQPESPEQQQSPPQDGAAEAPLLEEDFADGAQSAEGAPLEEGPASAQQPQDADLLEQEGQPAVDLDLEGQPTYEPTAEDQGGAPSSQQPYDFESSQPQHDPEDPQQASLDQQPLLPYDGAPQAPDDSGGQPPDEPATDAGVDPTDSQSPYGAPEHQLLYAPQHKADEGDGAAFNGDTLGPEGSAQYEDSQGGHIGLYEQQEDLGQQEQRRSFDQELAQEQELEPEQGQDQRFEPEPAFNSEEQGWAAAAAVPGQQQPPYQAGGFVGEEEDQEQPVLGGLAGCSPGLELEEPEGNPEGERDGRALSPGGVSGAYPYDAGEGYAAAEAAEAPRPLGYSMDSDGYGGGLGAGVGARASEAYNPGGGGYGARRSSAAAGGAPQELEAVLAMERERFTQELQMEVRAREELEDMILRIEKHFKAEQAARKKAEELLQAAIAAELEAKNRLEDLMKKRREEQRQLEEERNGIKRERNALESMRQDFEAELQAARSEVAKAQDALAASEDRIRAAEAVDRARLESEYQSKIGVLQEEVGRLRDELAYRTQLMASEMTRWQQQAHLTAAAVMEAKNEVLERKRELDSTKEKMDRLLEKLYIGRERGMELSGAIAAAQSYAQHAGAHSGLASMAGMMPPAMIMAAQGQGPGARGPALLAALSPPGGGAAGGYSNIPRLPPLNGRPSPPLFNELPLPAPPLSGGQRRSAPGGTVGFDMGAPGSAGPGGGMMPGLGQVGAGMGMGMGMGFLGPSQQGMMGVGGGLLPGMGMGMGIPMGPPMGPQGSFHAGSAPAGSNSADTMGPYAHVQSRYAQPSESAVAKADAARKGRTGNGKAGPKKPVDRFEESKKDEARLAAMAKRWG